MGIIPNDATYFHQPPSSTTGRTYLCYLWTNAKLHNTGAVWRSANLSGSGSFLEGLWEVQGAPLLISEVTNELGRFFPWDIRFLQAIDGKFLPFPFIPDFFFSNNGPWNPTTAFLQLLKPRNHHPPASFLSHQQVSVFYTAPTAIRSLMKSGDEPVTRNDLSSLRPLRCRVSEGWVLVGSMTPPWRIFFPETLRGGDGGE